MVSNISERGEKSSEQKRKPGDVLDTKNMSNWTAQGRQANT